MLQIVWLFPLCPSQIELVMLLDIMALFPLPLPFVAPSGRMSVIKNLQSLDPSHRISDRDYMGWMDFGRRSAEEYEYPS